MTTATPGADAAAAPADTIDLTSPTSPAAPTAPAEQPGAMPRIIPGGERVVSVYQMDPVLGPVVWAIKGSWPLLPMQDANDPDITPCMVVRFERILGVAEDQTPSGYEAIGYPEAGSKMMRAGMIQKAFIADGTIVRVTMVQPLAEYEQERREEQERQAREAAEDAEGDE
jgi:hypothetical protein